MKDNKHTINTTAKIVIPWKGGINQATQWSRDQLLNELKSITDDQIDDVSSDIECQKLISGLENERVWRLKEEDADILIDNWYVSLIWKHIKKFDSSSHKSIALKLINKVIEDGRSFNWRYLENFSWLDSDVALAMIRWGYSNDFYNRSDDFGPLNKEVAIALYNAIERTGSLKSFIESDRQEIALFYIKKWKNNVNLSHTQCNKDFANQIIWLKKTNWFQLICKYIECFPNNDHKEIALNLIKNWWANEFIEYIERFEWMDKEVALALAENDAFTPNLKIYPTDERQEIALNLLEHGYKPSLENVPRLNLEFANKLIEKKEFEFLRNNIQYFFDRDHKDIALAILNAWSILSQEDLRTIKNKDKEFAMTLLKYVQEHENSETSKNIIEHITNNPNEFSDLDDEVATILIDMWYWSSVKKHKKSFKDLSTYTKMRILMK